MTKSAPMTVPQKTSYYEILGVSAWASSSEIRQAYREKSKCYHPDTTRLPLPLAREKFEQLNQAYGVLSRPQLRYQYDAQRQTYPGKVGTTNSASAGLSWGLNVSIRERSLSAGEMFALFILGLTLVGCLVLAVVVGLSRGELMIQAWS